MYCKQKVYRPSLWKTTEALRILGRPARAYLISPAQQDIAAIMRVVITGGCGFLGQTLARAILRRGQLVSHVN